MDHVYICIHGVFLFESMVGLPEKIQAINRTAAVKDKGKCPKVLYTYANSAYGGGGGGGEQGEQLEAMYCITNFVCIQGK